MYIVSNKMYMMSKPYFFSLASLCEALSSAVVYY